MRIRTVITDRSVWKFDLDAQMYVRFPRNENPEHPSAVPYTGEWEPFDELIDPEEGESENRLLVIRPVPYGTGRLRMTGLILSDETVDTSNGVHAA